MNYIKLLVSIPLLLLMTGCSSGRHDINAKDIKIVPAPVEAETGGTYTTF